MKTRILVYLMVPLVCGASLAAVEQNALRGHLIYSNPTGDLRDGGVTFEAEDAFGLEVSWEFMFSQRLGLNLTVGTSEHDVEAESRSFSVTIGDLTVTPFTGALLFHLTPEADFDVYVGPALSYVLYGDVDVEPDRRGLPDEIAVDNDLTLGFEAGIDIPFGERGWAFNVNLKYLDTSAEIEDTGENLGIEPFVIGVGVAYRF